MNDEWRLQIDVHDPRHLASLLERLDAYEFDHDLSRAFTDRIIVSRDGDRIFVYAGTRKQIEKVSKLIASLAERRGCTIDAELTHWHPAAESWETPDTPLPVNDAARLAEHEALIATERRETEHRGYPEFEVRADLPSRHEAIRFAEQLRGEGLPVVHRWRFLLIGVTDEDSGKDLVARIRREAPSDAKVSLEGTWKAAYAERPPNPFAMFGGLGG